MITLQDVTYSYGPKLVLDHVSFSLKENELCALVGRNGAGKSTLIHVLLGLLPLKKGEITICGHSNRSSSWKQHVAYLPEKFQLYPNLTAEENLRFFAAQGSQPIQEEKMELVLKQVSLLSDKDTRIKGFSKGMLQRLGLGIMLYYDTPILILDEPTSGLDPIGRHEILTILKELKNKTILLSSHHMDEIQQICSHIAYLDGGRLEKSTVHKFSATYLFGGMSR